MHSFVSIVEAETYLKYAIKADDGQQSNAHNSQRKLEKKEGRNGSNLVRGGAERRLNTEIDFSMMLIA